MAIDGEAAAQRLARALLADLARYDRAKLAAGGDPRVALAPELAEARELFHARVAPSLHSIFERELVAFDFSATVAPARTLVVGAMTVVLVIVLAAAATLLLRR